MVRKIELAYQCGVLHESGKPVVAALMLQAETLTRAGADVDWFAAFDWMSIVQEFHRPALKILAEHWQLSSEMQDVLDRCDAYNREVGASVANVVRFAHTLAQHFGSMWARRMKPR